MTNWQQPSNSQLERGQIIPAFTLPGADGMPHSPWDYKQRENLIVLFVSGKKDEGKDVLRAFAQHYTDLREEMCSILAVTPETVLANLEVQEELRLPFPLLANPRGDVIARYTQWDETARTLTPSIVLTDRYGALQLQGFAGKEAELPSMIELLESLQYMNRLCTP